MAMNTSKNLTRAEIRSCTHSCATPWNQQLEKSIEISTITTYFLLTVTFHSYNDQSRSERISCKHYSATPCNQ